MPRRSRVKASSVSRLSGKKMGSWTTSEERQFIQMWADNVPIWKIAEDLKQDDQLGVVQEAVARAASQEASVHWTGS